MNWNCRKFANRRTGIRTTRLWFGGLELSEIYESPSENSNCPFIESLNRRIGIVGNSRIAERGSALTGSLIGSAIRWIGIVGNSRIAERESELLDSDSADWNCRKFTNRRARISIDGLSDRLGDSANQSSPENRESPSENSNCPVLPWNRWIAGLKLSEIRLSPRQN